MPDLALVKLRTAECHELITQLEDWLHDQNLVAKPALTRLNALKLKVDQLHSAAMTDYNERS